MEGRSGMVHRDPGNGMRGKVSGHAVGPKVLKRLLCPGGGGAGGNGGFDDVKMQTDNVLSKAAQAA